MDVPDVQVYKDKRGTTRGRAAVWQARLVLLAMINIAQLWILSATVEDALAGAMNHLVPLVAASFACWFVALTIILWWKPAGVTRARAGYTFKDAPKNNRI